MKRLIAYLLIISLPSLGMASVQTPKDDRGNTLPVTDWVGAIPFQIGNGTGTTAVLISSGRNVVYGVIVSSISQLDYLVFRDSGTANVTASTTAIVYSNGVSPNTAAVNGANVSGVIKFPVPIQFLNGLVVNDFTAPTNGAFMWTILYRPLKATE